MGTKKDQISTVGDVIRFNEPSTATDGITLSRLVSYNCRLSEDAESYADNELVRFEDITYTKLDISPFVLISTRVGTNESEFTNSFNITPYTVSDVHNITINNPLSYKHAWILLRVPPIIKSFDDDDSIKSMEYYTIDNISLESDGTYSDSLYLAGKLDSQSWDPEFWIGRDTRDLISVSTGYSMALSISGVHDHAAIRVRYELSNGTHVMKSYVDLEISAYN